MTPRRMSSDLKEQTTTSANSEQSDDSLIESFNPGSNPSRPDIDIQDYETGTSSSDISVEPYGSMPSPTERLQKKKRNATDSELINIEKEMLKLIERQMSTAENHDDNYHFVMSLLPMMRKLPPDAQLRARIKMLEILLNEMTNQTRNASGNEEQMSPQFSFGMTYTQL